MENIFAFYCVYIHFLGTLVLYTLERKYEKKMLSTLDTIKEGIFKQHKKTFCDINANNYKQQPFDFSHFWKTFLNDAAKVLVIL